MERLMADLNRLSDRIVILRWLRSLVLLFAKEGFSFSPPALLPGAIGLFGDEHHCARERFDVERVGAGRDDQIAILADLAILKLPGIFVERL